jgi:acetolactate synthase I/II/III large subunit
VRKSLGQYLVETLAAQGVAYVFGIPGVHNLELYRGLAASNIRHVTGRHEQGLGFMADGYARASRRFGVCFTITGPGLTNIATAMGQAYADSIPMLVVASENKLDEIGTGRGYLHEITSQLALASIVSGAAYQIRRIEDLPRVLTQIFTGWRAQRPRPSYIEIPRDVLAADASHLAPLAAVEPAAPCAADDRDINDAAQQLARAASPVILVGGGAIDAAADIRQLAERLGAPVVMTVNARGVLPPEHPLGVSMSASLAPVRALIASADVVLAIGTELGPTDYDMYAVSDFPQPRHVIRIDIDAQQLHRNARAALALQGDATATLRAMLQRNLGPPRASRGEAAARLANVESKAALSAVMRRQVEFLEVIRDVLPHALLVGDSTQVVYAGNLGFAAARPGSWFNSATGYGSLGYALPAATGASLAQSERPVVCLVGDGGIQFSLGELAVPRDVGAWLAIVVWNNSGYLEIKNSMLAVGIEPEGVVVQPPDFSAIAKAYGYAYQKIGGFDELRNALKSFAATRHVRVLEIDAQRYE